MNNELKVSFYLKRESRLEKSNREDVVYPILGKISIGNSIAQFSSKLHVSELLWNVKSGRATGKSRVAIELNREINKINLSIHHHYKDILERTGKVTATDVKNAFQGIATTQETLLGFFNELVQEFHLRVGIDRAHSTYVKYLNAQMHLERFIRAKYNVQDIPLTQLDLSFIESFALYLLAERKLQPETVNGRIILLQKAVRIALYRGLISRPPFFGYKPQKCKTKIKSLTAEEFERLLTISLERQTLVFARDMFIFSSFTGMAYSDVRKFTWKYLTKVEDGSLWISMFRQKTGTPFSVKLLDIPIQIIEKYRGTGKEDKVFPMTALTNMDIRLKIIAKLCGIDKPIAYHWSRHTFASQLCLSQGVPIETVSQMMGHRDIHTTQRYARVNNDKIANDMKILSARVAGKYTYVE